ncbi:MAG: NAD-dependent epimerase/dehydratase family protein [Planctomycetes bacterium]|nr:NAD-dependent epimerase/dehydratase family protein [Planctomycetota bacterium]
MKLLITGVCGFVGATLARGFRELSADYEVVGIDNLSRPGSWINRDPLERLGVEMRHGDIRNASDVDALPESDWVLDAAANPSVLAGTDGTISSRQLVEHNLDGTINLLEYCKKRSAGFVLLSTSRVYSIPPLAGLQMEEVCGELRPVEEQVFPKGISSRGVAEEFSTAPPVSLYGATKLASEQLALEYGLAFGFPVWINRCGVMAGAGQFGHPAQGIFAYWIHSFRESRPLRYLGFGGTGFQVRDCLHPRDIASLLDQQFHEPLKSTKPRVLNLSGGVGSSMSLRSLSDWCMDRFGPADIAGSDKLRQFDIPWMVLDNSLAASVWSWNPTTGAHDILEEIALHAERNPTWLDIAGMARPRGTT